MSCLWFYNTHLEYSLWKKRQCVACLVKHIFFISYSKKRNTLRNIWKFFVFFQILYCYQHSLSNKEIIFQFLNFFIKSLSVLCTYKNYNEDQPNSAWFKDFFFHLSFWNIFTAPFLKVMTVEDNMKKVMAGNHMFLTFKYYIQSIIQTRYTRDTYTPLHVSKTEYFNYGGYTFGCRYLRVRQNRSLYVI